MRTKFKRYEFLQAISSSITESPTMPHFLSQLPGIIQHYLPVKRAVVFYRSETGNRFHPYPETLDNKEVTPLDEQSNIIRSFVTHHRAMLMDSHQEIYKEIFNSNANQLLDRHQLNLLVPLHCRRYYRGLLTAWLDPRKKNYLKQIEQLLKDAATLFIPIIETERLEVENDRNYYRLFKFDRLVLLGEMVASISHELRTPMSTIKLEVQELEDQLKQNQTPESNESCGKIKEEILRVNQFIRNLLSFSKFKEISYNELSLNDFITDAMATMPRKRKPEGLKIITQLEHKQVIPIDQNRLRQVFFNILFNAFDVLDERSAVPGGENRGTAPGGKKGEIIVKAYSQHNEIDKDSRHIISIRDNGPGIPDELKKKVLEPFFTTKKDGTGLGLYISYGILQSLKGDLEIESNSEGTTVYIILPGG